MRKNAKAKVSPTKKEEGVAWKLRSPDEVLAQTSYEWNTLDGKPPVKVRCKGTRCPNFTDRPPFCDTHFYAMLKRIREGVMTKNADEMRANGNHR